VADGCEVNTQTDNNHCGGCNTNCATTCATNVQFTGCNNGSCSILSCQAGWYDIDGTCNNGCECAGSNTSETCSSANNLTPTALIVGQSITPFKSNLIPALISGNPNAAWFLITFSNNGASTAYHPKITLTDPLGEFVMDVVTSCGGAAFTCGAENTSASAITLWETSFTGPNPPADPSNIGYSDIYAGPVYVHVYRKTGKPVTCNQFTLGASE
jgi:hypothetical protein